MELRFFVQADQVRELLELKFGGIENFVDDWASMKINEGDQNRQSRSVKTVYKWLAEGMPKNEEAFFSFFGAIDADPIALLDFDRSNFRQHFGRFRQAIMMAGLNVGGFRPLTHFMRPGEHWPDNHIAERYFSKQWSSYEFVHEAKDYKNLDVTLRLSTHETEEENWPKAYHIAYRRLANADGLWRPYGSIIARFSETILVHENGDFQDLGSNRSKSKVEFKTFFGPSPAEFRLVSLHPFSAQLELYDDPDVVLRFAG